MTIFTFETENPFRKREASQRKQHKDMMRTAEMRQAVLLLLLLFIIIVASTSYSLKFLTYTVSNWVVFIRLYSIWTFHVLSYRNFLFITLVSVGIFISQFSSDAKAKRNVRKKRKHSVSKIFSTLTFYCIVLSTFFSKKKL